MNLLKRVERGEIRKQTVESFHPGDTVKVHVKVVESGKERIQVFEGIVISRRGGGLAETFTVRKISSGIGVERVFPVQSPVVNRIEVVRRGKSRRAKLYYLRGRVGKRAKVAELTKVAVKKPAPDEGPTAKSTEKAADAPAKAKGKAKAKAKE